jgi:hypothetical protein
MDYRSDLPAYDQQQMEAQLAHFEGVRYRLQTQVRSRPAVLPIPTADIDGYRELVRDKYQHYDLLKAAEKGLLEQFHQADDCSSA